VRLKRRAPNDVSLRGKTEALTTVAMTSLALTFYFTHQAAGTEPSNQPHWTFQQAELCFNFGTDSFSEIREVNQFHHDHQTYPEDDARLLVCDNLIGQAVALWHRFRLNDILAGFYARKSKLTQIVDTLQFF
jgi:hypothetical protein